MTKIKLKYQRGNGSLCRVWEIGWKITNKNEWVGDVKS